MIIFLRHAQRADNEHPYRSTTVPFDPPLTQNISKATMQRTSVQIKLLLQKESIQKVRIISSPFLRCLMTAEGVVESWKGMEEKAPEKQNGRDGRQRSDVASDTIIRKESETCSQQPFKIDNNQNQSANKLPASKRHTNIGFQIVDPFLIDDRLSQYMREAWFPYYPLPHLVFWNQSERNKYIKRNWSHSLRKGGVMEGLIRGIKQKTVGDFNKNNTQQNNTNVIQIGVGQYPSPSNTSISQSFPQSYPMFYTRLLNFLRTLSIPQKDTCNIYITHGFVVRQISTMMAQMPIRRMGKEVGYCGWVAYGRKNGNRGWRILEAKL